MLFIDLFAGVGGFHLAFKNLAECVLVSEIDTWAMKTYLANFKVENDIIAGDIKMIDADKVPDHDILCAGFPCQAFSLAGTQKGFAHKDGNLFFDILGIIKEKSPQVVFLENVKNLVSHDGGKTFAVITSELQNLGYELRYKILNSCDFNIPQNRERIFIVGFKDKTKADKFSFPLEVPLTTKLFGDIIDINTKVDDKYYQTNMSSPSVVKMHNGDPERGYEGVTKKKYIYQYRRHYVRRNESGLCPTLTANMGTGGHNVPLILDSFGIRKLTPRECFSLQGFPKSFVFPPNVKNSQLYKQAGNSITVPLVEAIAKQIIKAL